MRRTVLALSVVALVLWGSPACGGVHDDAGRPRTPTESSTAAPTIDPPEVVVFQEGNDQPITAIELKPFSELTGNGIGDGAGFDRDPLPCGRARDNWSFTHIVNLGLTWARVSTDGVEWESVRAADNYSEFRINRCQDNLASLFARKNIEMVFTIAYWNPRLHASRPPHYRSDREVRLFLRYARFLVRRFSDRIHYFEILNEAHVYVRLPDYLELIRRVVPVIRREDQDAKIVLDGTSTLLYPHVRHYLFGLLRSDVMPLVDGIALHPMYGASPQYRQTREYYEAYPALVRRIKRVAEAHGFAGEYFVEEMCWRTPRNSNPHEPWIYTPIVAAKYYARAIVMHLGMDVWAGLGGEYYDTIRPIANAVRNLSTVMDGAEPEELTVEAPTEATQVLTYGFALPNGDRMLALWRNGAAVDDDPGVATTLAFSSTSPGRAVGIDPLYGFQQELVTQNSGGSLVVPDLLVRDYPILVRLIGSTT